MEFDDSSRTLSAGSVLSEETVVPDEDDLSDEQIDLLLQRASLRMKSQSGILNDPENVATKLPQLKTASELPASYTVVQNGVARVKADKAVSSRTEEEQRRIADKPRKIEDPVTTKRNKKECESPLLASNIPIV